MQRSDLAPRAGASERYLMIRLAVVGGVLLGLAGCGSGLPSASQVTDLRVLGMQAEPPEGTVGASIALDALVLDPDPAADVQRAWVACVETIGASPVACAQGGSVTMPMSCGADPEATLCLLGTDPTATYTLPARARQGRQAAENGQVVITLIVAPTADGGVLGCVNDFAAAGAPPDYCRVAVKQIDVLPDGTTMVNHNPGVTDLTTTMEPNDAMAQRIFDLAATLAPDATEQTSAGPESLYFSWFVTGGKVDHYRGDGADGLVNVWTLDPSLHGPYTAAFVLRDGRGGESWITTSVTVP